MSKNNKPPISDVEWEFRKTKVTVAVVALTVLLLQWAFGG